MAGLVDKKIQDSYKSLLRVDDDTNGIDGSLANITDGEGTTGPFQISSTEVSFPSSSTLRLVNLEEESATQGFHINLTDSNGDDKNKISIPDNVDTAFSIKEGGNSYMKFTTTNSSEVVEFAKNVSILTDLDVDGTTNLDVVDIDGAVDMASTLTMGGDLTVNGGDVTISNSAGHANLNIDAHSNEASNSAIAFRSGTTERGYIYYDHNTTAASQKMVFNVGDNAVVAMSILGDGKVGIGTTSPSYKLHVAEDLANDYAAYIINDNADGSGLRLRCDDSDGDEYLFYAENSTTARFAIKSDGKTGIGTASPSTPLEVHAESGGSTFSIAKFDLNTIDFPRAGTFRIGYGNSADYDLSIKQAVSSGLVKYLFDVRNNGTDYANNLVLDRGKVGIGTASPSASLHVSGSAILQNDSSTLNFYNTAGAQRAFLQLSGTGLIIDTDSFLEFKPNNTTAMYIDSSGNVGVGTTSPNISGWNANYAVLTIKGDTTNYGGVLELANPDSTGNYFGTVSFVNMDGGSSTVANARISGTRDGVDDASALTFETEPTGGAVTERMRINSGGGINCSGIN